MKECLKLMLAVALLAAIGADLGLDVGFIFASPSVEQGSYDRSEQRYSGDANPSRHPPGSLYWFTGSSEAQPRTNTAQPQNPAPDQHSTDIWMILQGLSAPIVAFFTLVLMCVGWGQLRAISRQADISEKALVLADRAYLFVKEIRARSHYDTANRIMWWSFDVVWENTGETPTRRLRVYTGRYLETADIPPAYAFKPDFGLHVTTAGPGRLIEGVPVTATEDDLKAVQKREKFMYVWGVVQYRDIFPGTPEHVTKFCWRLHFMGDPSRHHDTQNNCTECRWVHYHRHNCADEECAMENLMPPH